VVVVIVVIVVMVVMAACGVRPGFRIKWCVDQVHVAAETFDHIANDMIGPDSDAIAKQLDRKMAVAQVPGDADEFAVLMRMDFHQRFRLGAHVDDASVIQQQAVAVTQTDRLRQVDQHLGARAGGQENPSTVAAIEVNEDLIRFAGGIPGASRQDGLGAHQNRK
jgi:hypothetical protein